MRDVRTLLPRPRTWDLTAKTLAAVVLVGSVARVLLHRGVGYSPADEAVYARYACFLTQEGLGGYPAMVQGYLVSPEAHLYPSPARWGFLLPGAAASEALGCGPASIAWLSTLSGIAMLCVIALFARRHLPGQVAVIATVFVASSPLQLIVGRRALGDELLGFVVVLAWWALWSHARRGTPLSWGLACLTLVLGFGVKEIFFLAMPAVVVPLLWERWRHRPTRRVVAADLALLMLPVLINGLIVAALARSWSADIEMLQAIASTTNAAYPATYMAGPIHRLPVDLMLVSPALTFLALVSLGLLLDRGASLHRILAISALMGLLPYAVVDAQSLRLVVAAETFIAILAAWGLATLLRTPRRLNTLAVGTVVVWNTWMVWTLSLRGEIYDPVTEELVRILGMTP